MFLPSLIDISNIECWFEELWKFMERPKFFCSLLAENLAVNITASPVRRTWGLTFKSVVRATGCETNVKNYIRLCVPFDWSEEFWDEIADGLVGDFDWLWVLYNANFGTI